jgi:hypothetical protein
MKASLFFSTGGTMQTREQRALSSAANSKCSGARQGERLDINVVPDFLI